jgi:hypothetical protein
MVFIPFEYLTRKFVFTGVYEVLFLSFYVKVSRHLHVPMTDITI